MTAGGSAILFASSQPAAPDEATASVASTPPDVREGGGGVPSPRMSSALEGLERIPWREEGYLSWEYDGHKINYVDEGDKEKVGGVGGVLRKS